MRLSTKRGQRGSALDEFRQSGSLKCLYPRGSGPGLEAMLINTAGGITGGDAFALHAAAGADTRLTLTTQAAERAYAVAGENWGHLKTHLTVGPQARVDWLPQETILFEHSALRRSLTVDLAENSTFLMVEPLIFGRIAMGEVLSEARFRDRAMIRRGGVPLFADQTDLRGDITGHLAKPQIAKGAGAMALVVYVGADAESFVDPLRHALPPTAGLSLIGPDVLTLRALAPDSNALRKSLIPMLERLNRHPLPRCWSL